MKISEDKLKRLSKRERLYLDIMMSGNSLYLRGNPGGGKSAIGLSISRKLEFRYIDKRLSQIDETDIGLYPVLKNHFNELEKISKLKKLNFLTDEEFQDLKKDLIFKIKNIETDTLSFAVPDWALEANSSPTIIHIEELNRANSHVRNAALQLLNERQIGNLLFNENVLIMSSGNYGDLDGTEVDEMDLALTNRLCILDHELTAEEWIKEYASIHVLPLIVDYIRTKPSELCKFPNQKEIRWASPRSWTNLSKFLIYRHGLYPDIKEEIIPELLVIGKGFIGSSVAEFIRYCKDISNINIRDIIERWDEIKDGVDKFNRSRLSEMITNLKSVDLMTISNYQLENIIKFLDSIWKRNGDELSSYLLNLLDKTNETNFDIHNKIIQKFVEKSKTLKDYISKNLKN